MEADWCLSTRQVFPLQCSRRKCTREPKATIIRKVWSSSPPARGRITWTLRGHHLGPIRPRTWILLEHRLTRTIRRRTSADRPCETPFSYFLRSEPRHVSRIRLVLASHPTRRHSAGSFACPCPRPPGTWRNC